MPRRTFRSVEIRRLRKSLKAATKNLAITLAVESEDEEDDGSSMSDEEGYDGDGDDDDMSYDMSSDDDMSYESGSKSDSDVDDAILEYMTATYELDDVLAIATLHQESQESLASISLKKILMKAHNTLQLLGPSKPSIGALENHSSTSQD